jgi:hypothetical protein
MEDNFKQNLLILRKNYPIGLQHGLFLLKKANGSIKKAENFFREELLSKIIDLTGVNRKIAKKHLTKNKFDITLALQSIENELFTFTKVILKNSKTDKEETLKKIKRAFHIENNLYLGWYDYYYNIDYLKSKGLSNEIFCFLTTMDWLENERGRGLLDALSFNLEVITKNLDEVLKLPELSLLLKEANEYRIQLDSKIIYPKHNYHKRKEKLHKDKKFKKYTDDFKLGRVLIINQLFKLVENNLSQFPQ